MRSPSDRRVFIDGPATGDAVARAAYARKIVKMFADRAFRRPVDEPTFERLVSLAGAIEKAAGKSPNAFEQGISQALIAILAVGRTDLLRLEWTDAVVISILLAYAQRGCAWLIAGKRRARLGHFLLEPVMTNFVSTLCFLAALWTLIKLAGKQLIQP
jgi:hypothetical protein